jgi:hypothetical protein
MKEKEAMIPTYICKEIYCKIMPVNSTHEQILPNRPATIPTSQSMLDSCFS